MPAISVRVIKRARLIIMISLVLFVFLSQLTGCTSLFSLDRSSADALESVDIELWHYYSGDQKLKFDSLIDTYNETEGAEKNVQIKAASQGNVSELADLLLKLSAAGETLPDISAVYADFAYELTKSNQLVNLSEYLTVDNLDSFPKAFLASGYLRDDEKLFILPWGKATEVLVVDRNAWEEFASAAGYPADPAVSLISWESVAAVSEEYYHYSGGRHFAGIDSIANFIISGCMQMGCPTEQSSKGESLTLDKETFRRIWDVYYQHTVLGGFGSKGRFRTDDLKSGEIVAAVISSAGGMYLPDLITDENGSSREAEYQVLRYPVFEGGQSVCILQGAGFSIAVSDRYREQQAVDFLLWLSRPEQNIMAAVSAGYIPVTQAALSSQLFKNELAFNSNDEYQDLNSKLTLLTATDQLQNYQPYAYPAFENSMQVRRILDTSLTEAAASARMIYLEGLNAGHDAEMLREQLISSSAFESWYSELMLRIIRLK